MTSNYNFGYVKTISVEHTASLSAFRGVAEIPTTNQIAIARNVGAQTNAQSVMFCPKVGTSYNLSDSSSILNLTQSNLQAIVYIPTTDQLAVVSYTSNVIVFISRNGTNAFGSDSIVSSISATGNPMAIAYISSTGQLAVAFDNSSVVSFISRSGVNPFNSSSTISSATLIGSANTTTTDCMVYISSADQVVLTLSSSTVQVVDRNGTNPFGSDSVVSQLTGTGTNPRSPSYASSTEQLIVFYSSSSFIRCYSKVNGRFTSSSPSEVINLSAVPSIGLFVPGVDEILCAGGGDRLSAIRKSGANAYGSTSIKLFGYDYILTLTTIDYLPIIDKVLITANASATFLDRKKIESTVSLPQYFSVPSRVTFSSPTDQIYITTNEIIINSTITYFSLSGYLDIANQNYNLGYTRTSDTQSTLNNNFTLVSTAEITGDFTITIASSKKIKLGSRSTYTEKFVISSGATILVNQNVSFPNFTISNGAIIDNSSATPVTVEVSSNQASALTIASPTTGGGSIILQSPQITLTLTNIVAGSEVIIKISGTSTQLLKETALTSSKTFSYNTIGQVVDIQVLKEGYQVWASKQFDLPSVSQSVRVNQQISTAWKPQ